MKRDARTYSSEQDSIDFRRLAERRHSRRAPGKSYADEVKNADKTFGKNGGRVSEEDYQKWARNPSKYDIEGVDDKREKEKMPPGLRRSSNVFDMRMNEVEIDTREPVEPSRRNTAALDKKLSVSKSDKLDIDSGGSDLGFNSSSGDQKGLGGFV